MSCQCAVRHRTLTSIKPKLRTGVFWPLRLYIANITRLPHLQSLVPTKQTGSSRPHMHHENLHEVRGTGISYILGRIRFTWNEAWCSGRAILSPHYTQFSCWNKSTLVLLFKNIKSGFGYESSCCDTKFFMQFFGFCSWWNTQQQSKNDWGRYGAFRACAIDDNEVCGYHGLFYSLITCGVRVLYQNQYSRDASPHNDFY